MGLEPLVERPFAHLLRQLGCGGSNLPGHSNILKRLLVPVASLNLGLLLCPRLGSARPVASRGAVAAVLALIGPFVGLWSGLEWFLARFQPHSMWIAGLSATEQFS